MVGLFLWSWANDVLGLLGWSNDCCRGRFSDDNSSGFFLLAITGTELSNIGVVGLAPEVSSKKPSPPNIPPSGEENPGLILLTDDAGVVLWSGVVIIPCLWVFDTILNVRSLELRGVTALSETEVPLQLDFSLKLKVLWFSGLLLVGAFSAWCGRLVLGVVSGGRDLG